MAPLVFVLLLLAMPLRGSDGAWCVCRPDVADAALQKTLDYACGHGADCAAVLPTGPCYSPTTVRAHCSYAANSYFQRNSQANGATCDFGGTANLTDTDPSTYSTHPLALDTCISQDRFYLSTDVCCRLQALELANTLQHQAKQGQAATQPARARARRLQALRVTRLRRPAREGASRHLSARLAPRLAPSARAPPPPPCLLVAMPSSSPSSPSCLSRCADLLDQKESEAASSSVFGEDLTIVRSSSLMFLAVFVTSAHENGSSLITLPELSCFKKYDGVNC